MADVEITSTGKVSSGALKNLGLAGVDRGLILGAQVVAQRATQKAPIQTGRLKRSITAGRPYTASDGSRMIDIGTNVVYARIQEFGGKIPAHTISPRVKQALAFGWPGAPSGLSPGTGGKFVFRSVNHPGAIIPAQPYLRPAISESTDTVKTIIINSVIGAIRS